MKKFLIAVLALAIGAMAHGQAITSPAAGSTLTGSTATFTWTAGTNVTQYQLWIGTKAMGDDVALPAIAAGATSVSVSGLPTTGATLYVTLMWESGGTWSNAAYTYTEAAAAAASGATTTTPAAGYQVTLTWTAAPLCGTPFNGVTVSCTSIAYRCAGTCTASSTWTQVGTQVADNGPYIDTAPPTGLVSYYVTDVANGGGIVNLQSLPSSIVTVTVPAVTTPAPTSTPGPTGVAGTVTAK